MALRGIGESLGKLARSVLQSHVERERAFYLRFRALSGKIDERPDDMVAYVLRGELNLERGENERAAADFKTALEVAERADDANGWLVMEQVMRDRALHGLKLAERGI